MIAFKITVSLKRFDELSTGLSKDERFAEWV
jgi:hypothetical protein